MDALGAGGSRWLVDTDAGSAPRVTRRPKPLYGPRSILRHKAVVGLICAVCLLAALLHLALRPLTYTASIQLLIYSRNISTGLDAVILPGEVDVPLVQNQIEILRSRAVLSKVIEALQLTRDPEFFPPKEGVLQRLKKLISFRPAPVIDENILAFGTTLDALRRKLTIRRVGTSHIVQMYVTASRPEKAARIANEAAGTYLQERRRAIGEALAIRELYQGLGPNAYVISEAEPPIAPDGLPAWMIVAGAILLGLSGGAALAFLLDVLDNSIRAPDQLEHWLGLDCLAVVPCLDDDHSPSDAGGRGERATLPRAAEIGVKDDPAAARSLGGVMALIQETKPAESFSLGVTSVRPGDGSTTIAVALARLMAASRLETLLIDAVPEHPTLTRWAKSGPVGVVGTEGPDGVAFGGGLAVDMGGGLHVLPVAASVGSDSSSICPAALAEHVRLALKRYDRVVVDMPSLVSGADVRAAARALDGILLIVDGETDCDLARQAIASAGEAHPKFVGAVLNRAGQRAIDRHADGLGPVVRPAKDRRPGGATGLSDAAMADRAT